MQYLHSFVTLKCNNAIEIDCNADVLRGIPAPNRVQN